MLLATLTVILTIAAVLLLVAAVVFFVETVTARQPAESPTASVPRPRVAVLVPAHDEASGIAASLATIVPQLGPLDRLVVVADNCADDTAAVALAAGAEVASRDDPERRGKGYALDFGVRHLAVDAPEVVVIIDADCELHPGSLERLAALCVATCRPVQSLDLCKAPPGGGLPMRIAEFAWVVKNQVRPLGLQRLGLPCQLMGTGMAFPWALIEHAPLATGHIVEDMRLGLDLAASGHAPLFCPQACVTSYFAPTRGGVESQRTRWEHGHLSVIAEFAPRLFWQAVRRWDVPLAVIVLDLCVPPLASLVLLLGVVVAAGAIVFAFGSGAVPLAIAISGLALVATGVAVSWHRYGRAIVSARDLAGVPAYIWAKLPIYGRALLRRESRWMRADRKDGAPK